MANKSILQATPIAALRIHWPEYLIEAWALGMFMLSAGVFTTLFEYPQSALHLAIGNNDVRRVLTGVAMGLTAVALIYSPWGQRSGAHMNPAVTLTFWRLGKVTAWNAMFYVIAQFIGGTLGVYLTIALLHSAFTLPPVNYIVTVPGETGISMAFIAELIISAFMMLMILQVSNSKYYARLTGVIAGLLVALYISLEAPLSGMSMNPARSFASAFPAQQWTAFWIYIIAPVAGMQAAAAWFIYRRSSHAIGCAKLLHATKQRCIHCGYTPSASGTASANLSGVAS